MNTRSSDFLSGALLTVCALFFWERSGHLAMGSLTAMGPGYFPRLLSVLLACIGLALIVRGLRQSDIAPGLSIAAAPAIVATGLFGFLIEPVGLLAASAATAALASVSMRTSLLQTAAIALASAVIAGTIAWGIGLPLPLIPHS